MFVFYILRFLLWKPDKKSRFLNAHLDYLLTVLTPYFILLHTFARLCLVQFCIWMSPGLIFMICIFNLKCACRYFLKLDKFLKCSKNQKLPSNDTLPEWWILNTFKCSKSKFWKCWVNLQCIWNSHILSVTIAVSKGNGHWAWVKYFLHIHQPWVTHLSRLLFISKLGLILNDSKITFCTVTHFI